MLQCINFLKFNQKKKRFSGGRGSFSREMENYSTFSGRVGFLWFFLGIFLLFGRAKAGESNSLSTSFL